MGMGNKASCELFSLVFLLFIVTQSRFCAAANNTISRSKTVSIGETITSAGQIFELGFFSPGNSSNLYVGIWYQQIPVRKVVWVANRENPLINTGSTSGLTIGDDGNVRLVDGNQNILWSTNISVSSNNSVAVLLDNGNLVLRDVSGNLLWESFSHPCDTVLPGMKISKKTIEKLHISSWKTENNPSMGNFVAGITLEKPPQAMVWKGSVPYWRSGQWNGFGGFIGMAQVHRAYLNGFSFVPVQLDNQYYYTFTLFNTSYVRIITITPAGALSFVEWNEGMKEWNTVYNVFISECDAYGKCGSFGVCNKKESPICMCLRGFVPRSHEEWRKGNWTGGCVRQTKLLCERRMDNLSSSTSGKIDGFWKFSQMKLPDRSIYVQLDDVTECKTWCLNNCSCLGYAYISGIGCTTWAENLLDTQELLPGGEDLFLRLANPELGKENKREKHMIISFSVISCIAFLGFLTYGLCRWKAKQRGKRVRRNNHFNFSEIFSTTIVAKLGKNLRRNGMKQQDPSQLPVFDLDQIEAATNKFSISNKLGEGGFGPVFKGELENGQEIAVKKLSRCSGQGIQEFKNEIILISKLQHKNLVRLLGCCVEGEELLIVYEYMPNRSLDTLLFDSTRRSQLDWAKRFNIIQGIARGLLYLHHDSCLKIIHRDLKVSNILLDKDMNPKISDFGLARTFRGTQELANTRRVVGTFGYMSPEYAMRGIYSEKSDIFSFGVLLLEIVSGKKNSTIQNHDKQQSLLGYAWQLWSEGMGLDFMDQVLMASSFSLSEVMRCIHVGLLCVQEHVADRPAMPSVVLMLSSETDGPKPKQPPFTFQSLLESDLHSQNKSTCSVNEVTESTLDGR